MVGLAEGELGSSSQTHSLASNKSRWDRRVVDSSDVTKEEGTIKQGQMMAAGAQMKETVDKTPSASIGDTEDIFEGTENEGVGVKNYGGKTFFLFFYTSLTNSLSLASRDDTSARHFEDKDNEGAGFDASGTGESSLGKVFICFLTRFFVVIFRFPTMTIDQHV